MLFMHKYLKAHQYMTDDKGLYINKYIRAKSISFTEYVQFLNMLCD